MPLLIAIIHNFHHSNSEEPQAGEGMLAGKAEQDSSALERLCNQNTTCEKENQHPQQQGKVAAVTTHTPAISWGGGKELLKQKNETFKDRSEEESCAHAQEVPCPHSSQCMG